MKKHIKPFFALLSIYFSLSIFSLNLLGAPGKEIPMDVKKDLCSKGSIFKRTLRSYAGELCGIELLGYVAQELCKEVEDFEKSDCKNKIKIFTSSEKTKFKTEFETIKDYGIASISDLMREASPYLSETDRAKIEKRFPNISLKEKQVTPGGQKEPEKVGVSTPPKPEPTPLVIKNVPKPTPRPKSYNEAKFSGLITNECKEDIYNSGFNIMMFNYHALDLKKIQACPMGPECEKLTKNLEEMKAKIKACFPEESKDIK